MSDFWDSVLNGNLVLSDGQVTDTLLDEESSYLRFAEALPGTQESAKTTDWLGSRPRSGMRVAFANTVEAILTYEDFPEPVMGANMAEGSVVTLRTSSGDTTAVKDRVFVQWDDGKLRPIFRNHLRPASGHTRVASSYRKVVSNLGDLTGFIQPGNGTDLVHKATQDLWSCRQDGDNFIIERLFDGNGEPLKGV